MITIDPPSRPHTEASALTRESLTRFLGRARAAVGLAGEVDVLLTGDDAIRRLNRSFRGKNKATDVLSFAAPPELRAISAGDLAVSLETAARQAEAHGHALATELRILLLHGLLHLAGLDHETDTGEMAAREAELRGRFRLPSGLIARTMATADGGTAGLAAGAAAAGRAGSVVGSGRVRRRARKAGRP